MLIANTVSEENTAAEENTLDLKEEVMETEQVIEKLSTVELINEQYVYDVTSFVIFLFLILSFTDVGVTIVSKIISFFKTVFDDIDLSFMRIRK